MSESKQEDKKSHVVVDNDTVPRKTLLFGINMDGWIWNKFLLAKLWNLNLITNLLNINGDLGHCWMIKLTGRFLGFQNVC